MSDAQLEAFFDGRWVPIAKLRGVQPGQVIYLNTHLLPEEQQLRVTPAELNITLQQGRSISFPTTPAAITAILRLSTPRLNVKEEK